MWLRGGLDKTGEAGLGLPDERGGSDRGGSEPDSVVLPLCSTLGLRSASRCVVGFHLGVSISSKADCAIDVRLEHSTSVCKLGGRSRVADGCGRSPSNSAAINRSALPGEDRSEASLLSGVDSGLVAAWGLEGLLLPS